MARSRKKDPSATTEQDTSFNPSEFDPAMQVQAAEIVHGVAEATRIEPEAPGSSTYSEQHPSTGFASQLARSTNGHAATIERKTYAKPADPFGFESTKAGENRVQLLKSEGHQAWVIRFAHNPNEDKGPNGETYSKENPHPVLKMLKEEGFRWGFDSGDGKGGWGKPFSGDAYGTDHIEARRVLQKSADMIGHTMDQGRIPD